MENHSCRESKIHSQVLSTCKDGVFWVMHLVRMDDEDVLVTTFCTRESLDDSYFGAFNDRFLDGLRPAISSHPAAALCESCRQRDIEPWKQEFTELVCDAYGSVGGSLMAVDDEEIPNVVMMEFESMLRDSEGVERSNLN